MTKRRKPTGQEPARHAPMPTAEIPRLASTVGADGKEPARHAPMPTRLTEERIVDGDFPQEIITRQIFFLEIGGKAQPAPDDDGVREKLAALHRDNRLAARLERDRLGLRLIADTPEYGAGMELLARAERSWRRAQDESIAPGARNEAGDAAHAALDHLVDTIRAGIRRRDTRPILSRDAARQEGTQKPRGSRMPLLDQWLDSKLSRYPKATADRLWNSLPRSDGELMYRDGEDVYEVRADDRAHHIGRDGFNKRTTAARKRIRADSK